MSLQPEYSEHEMIEIQHELENAYARIGRDQNLAFQARQLIGCLITADGPDALWNMVCAGLGPEIVTLDQTLKAIQMNR